jgi:hypothetical protein
MGGEMCKEKEERGTERESSFIVYIEMQKGDKLRSREYVRSKFWHTGIAMGGDIISRGGAGEWYRMVSGSLPRQAPALRQAKTVKFRPNWQNQPCIFLTGFLTWIGSDP